MKPLQHHIQYHHYYYTILYYTTTAVLLLLPQYYYYILMYYELLLHYDERSRLMAAPARICRSHSLMIKLKRERSQIVRGARQEDGGHHGAAPSHAREVLCISNLLDDTNPLREERLDVGCQEHKISIEGSEHKLIQHVVDGARWWWIFCFFMPSLAPACRVVAESTIGRKTRSAFLCLPKGASREVTYDSRIVHFC